MSEEKPLESSEINNEPNENFEDFLNGEIDKILNDNQNINDREKKIIRLRFGVDKNSPTKIRELAKLFKTSPRKMKEEVDSIEKKIFNKLKRNI